ncbi:hypothetical protein, variant 1 [Exophiala mesophila]|uniref:Uncharacterized protein n=1 Tax=Exophiala mesophila TaxID=212818 RepID=A0A0D1X351_EXOME|nr:hypothetical protein, variant 1 [Exophiala mesophila]KIV96210.1 hypothetical protein, variant 1 [Exophiala mesophila]
MLHVMTCLSCHSTVGERHHRLGSVQGISPRVPRICTFTIVDGDDWIPEMSGTEGILRTLGIPKSSYLPTKVVVLNQNYLGTYTISGHRIPMPESLMFHFRISNSEFLLPFF